MSIFENHLQVNWKQHFVMLLGLLAFSIAIRFPWFSIDIIDPDESVFILTGQFLSRGHLPYTIVWDIKPPLGFVFFATILTFFDNSLMAVRVAGAFLVALSGYLVFLISATFTKAEHAMLGAIFTVIGLSLLVPSAQCVMMEHVAIVPLLAALALIIRNPSPFGYVLIGMFLAMATLVRTNFAYVAVTVLLGSALIPNNQDKYARSTRMPAIIFGGASVLIITILPYALTGQLPLFYKSAVLIPLDYSNGGLSYFEVAKAMLDNAVSAGTGAIFRAYQFSLWIGGLSGLLSLFASPICRRKPLAAIWISTFLAATLASILSAGHPWGHYLLQLVPFFAIGVGLLASAIFSFRPIRQMSIAPIHVAIIVSLLIMSRYTIADAIGRLKDHGMNEYGPSYAVAEQLKYKLKPTDTLFITHDILTYWILQKTPLVPIAIFPLNIFVDSITKHLYGFSVTSEDVLEQIMDRNPTVIVVPKNSQFQTSKVFINKLSRNYILYKELTVPAFRSWRPFLSDQDRLIFWNKRASIVSAYK